ncbi:hypothetical protein FNV43_RR07176 [Rhamnella rubrinervis]|uniref:Polygalacturonase n=1 Tax=Rhamnella rubrinervis TaxID=2594499 RepID=A0A8K0MM48_9ROSA|nr:hypothetical protein FNV43_RR07176 [Rhamnella rubrinervis]
MGKKEVIVSFNGESMLICFIWCLWAAAAGGTSINRVHVVSYGAKADGKTDSTKAFLKAWVWACSSGATMLKAVEFRGPCKNRVTVEIDGTLVAPTNHWAMGNSGNWILFVQVNRLAVYGGTLDAKGAAFWACKRSGKSCPVGARSITINWANDIVISGSTSINSQLSHMVINSCNNVLVRNVNLIASSQSPNTDGTKNLFMKNINCGPGHGVSIGSLGKVLKEDGVQNVTLTDAVFTGSDNGVRIKSWARPSNGITAPNNQGCPQQSSGVKISGVTYRNIKGTSATAEAIKFDCSRSNPCRGIRLQDIKLTYRNRPASSSCNNIRGATTTGLLIPSPTFL